MPTNNSSVNSHLEYTECLDTLHNIISKYRQTHVVILCGDFNGTLLEARPYNKHDCLLQTFVNEQYLSSVNKSDHTFFHHAGTSSSQIDYILSSKINILQNYQIGGRESENSSSHVKVTCELSVSPPGSSKTSRTKSTQSVKKLQWEKINRSRYESVIDQELKQQSTDCSVSGLEIKPDISYMS